MLLFLEITPLGEILMTILGCTSAIFMGQQRSTNPCTSMKTHIPLLNTLKTCLSTTNQVLLEKKFTFKLDNITIWKFITSIKVGEDI